MDEQARRAAALQIAIAYANLKKHYNKPVWGIDAIMRWARKFDAYIETGNADAIHAYMKEREKINNSDG